MKITKINTDNWTISDYDNSIKKLEEEKYRKQEIIKKLEEEKYKEERKCKTLVECISELKSEKHLKLQQMKDDFQKREIVHKQEGEYLKELENTIKSYEGIKENVDSISSIIKSIPVDMLHEYITITVIKEYKIKGKEEHKIKGKHKSYVANTKAGATALFINQKHASEYRNISESAISKSVNSNTDRTIIKDKQGNPILDKNGEKEYRTYCERQIQIKSVDVKKFYKEVENNPEDISVLKKYSKYGDVNK